MALEEPLPKRYALATEPVDRMAIACAALVMEYAEAHGHDGTMPSAEDFKVFFKESGCLEREIKAAKTDEIHWWSRHEMKGREEYLLDAENALRLMCEVRLSRSKSYG